MPRNQDMDRRLRNWARWRIGSSSGGLGYASAKLGERVDFDGEARLATVDHEAEETDRAVQALEGRLRMTVIRVYVDAGSIRAKAAELCCTERTVHARIEEAHRVLAGWLADRAATARAERERVEQLQRGGRL